jgi:hypothetical protein
VGTGRDAITDFNAGTSTSTFDRIHFETSGFTAVMFLGAGSFMAGSMSMAVQVRFDDMTDVLEADYNDDGMADVEISLAGVSLANLDNGDFIAALPPP